MSGRASYKCHLIVPLWGADYIRRFFGICLPTQLAPGNLPALSRLAEWSYHIITRPGDGPVIVAAPGFRSLSELGPTRVIELPSSDFQASNHYLPFSDCYREGMRLAAQEGAASLFLTADQLWADGSLARVVELGRAGAEAVLGSGPRLLQESFSEFFAQTYGAEPRGAVAFSSRQGVGWALEYLHPWDRSLIWDERGRGRRASFLFWMVEGDGFLLRCLHMHPILLNPRGSYSRFSHTIDGGDLIPRACPDFSHLVVIDDSDQAFFCSLAPAEQSAQWIGMPRVDWLGFARWALGTGLTRHNLFYLSHVLRFHQGAGNSASWLRAERLSTELADRVSAYLDNPAKLALFRGLASVRRPLGVFMRSHTALHTLYRRLRRWV